MKTKKRVIEESTEVAVQSTGRALALPVEWQESLASQAKEDSALEQPSVQAFKTSGGILSYNGNAMPDNKMNVIVLGAAFINSLFINKYDPSNIISPLCFALSEDGEEMAPHENSFKPQSPGCVGCEHAEWGSDENSPSGRGKACKETRRLVVIPEDALNDGIEKAVAAIFNVPVTSVSNWGNYVHTMAATAKRPTWSVVTEILLKPDPKNQFMVNFSAVDVINNPKHLEQLTAVRQKAKQAVMTPFAMMTQEQFEDIQTAKAKPAKKRKF